MLNWYPVRRRREQPEARGKHFSPAVTPAGGCVRVDRGRIKEDQRKSTASSEVGGGGRPRNRRRAGKKILVVVVVMVQTIKPRKTIFSILRFRSGSRFLGHESDVSQVMPSRRLPFSPSRPFASTTANNFQNVGPSRIDRNTGVGDDHHRGGGGRVERRRSPRASSLCFARGRRGWNAVMLDVVW